MTDETATAIMAASTPRNGYAIARLLHRLQEFMRAYPISEADPMPEHDLVFVEGLGAVGPGETILEAIKAHPELWRDTLPREVCIVPRKVLEQLGLSADIIDHLTNLGDYYVDGHAAKYRHELESRSEHDRRRSSEYRPAD